MALSSYGPDDLVARQRNQVAELVLVLDRRVLGVGGVPRALGRGPATAARALDPPLVPATRITLMSGSPLVWRRRSSAWVPPRGPQWRLAAGR